MTPLEIALSYIEMGLCPIPIPYREKGPKISGWEKLQITKEDAPHYFNGAPQNIGIILGEASKGLVDVDIDCDEALYLASHLLPATGGRFGRASKRASHWLYFSNVPKHIKYEDPNIDGAGKTIVELRSGGVQTVFPGSTHVSGEFIGFEDDADPTKIAAVERTAIEAAVGVLAAACLLARYFPKKGRHDFCLALGGGLLRDGWNVDEAEMFVLLVAWVGGSDNPKARAAGVRGTKGKLDANEPVTGWNRVTELIADRPLGGGVGGKKLVSRARKWLPKGTADLPRILMGLDLDRVVREVLGHLSGAHDLYQRGGELVRVVPRELDPRQRLLDLARVTDPNAPRPTAHVERSAGAPTIRAHSRATLERLLSLIVRFETMKFTKDDVEIVPCAPSPKILANLIEGGEWPGVPPLVCVAPHPIVRADGSIAQADGYDELTGYFLSMPPGMSPIDEHPTLEKAQAAAARLWDLLGQFPWASPAAFSAWLALGLTMTCRAAIAGPTPMFAIVANVKGAGKSRLIDVICIIVTGHPTARATQPTSEEEAGKVLTSIAIEGDALVLFDNVDRPLGGGKLDAWMTGERWKDRILGENKNVDLPITTVIAVTGNNVSYVGDTADRVLPVHLVSDLENPRARNDLRIPNLLDYVRANRCDLLACLLTIARAWFVASRPRATPTQWGSYEGWVAVVPQIITWLGLPDPMTTREAIHDDDPASVALRTLVTLWSTIEARKGRAGLTARELVETVYVFGHIQHGCEDVAAALEQLAPGTAKEGAVSINRLAYVLRSVKGRVFGGLRIVPQGDRLKAGQRWTVR